MLTYLWELNSDWLVTASISGLYIELGTVDPEIAHHRVECFPCCDVHHAVLEPLASNS